MPPQSVSLNTPVNARVRKILHEMDMTPSLRTSNSMMTDMYGSGRVEKYVASGNSGSYPSASMGDYQSVSGVPERLIDVSVGGALVKKRVVRAVRKAVKAEILEGGKVNRLKKAKRWTNYAVDTAGKGIDLAVKAKNAYSGVTTGLDSIKKLFGGKKAVGGKKPRARALLVKEVMKEQGLSMIEASKYVKAHGLY